MSFLEPIRLWLVLGVVALAAAYLLLQLRRRRYVVKFTNMDLLASVAPKHPGWRRHLPAGIYLLTLLALVLGFARPVIDEQVPRERATIILAIDTSLSMAATDVSPSRLAAAQDAATTFVEDLPEPINLGLVLFDGSARLAVPPTLDRSSIVEAIETMKLGQGTAIGDALTASLAAIELVPPDKEGTPPPARIVLMSDGTTTMGLSNREGTAAATDAEVPVSTIAFGTEDGYIKIGDDPYPVPVPVDLPSLEAIADDTGGQFYAADSKGELDDVYQDIGSSVGYETVETEISTWFVGGGLVLLIAAGGLSLIWFSRLP